MADPLPVVPASTELTPVSLKSMNRSQLMNLAERMGYDGPAAGQRSVGSLMTKLVRQLGLVGKYPPESARSDYRAELGITESLERDMERAYARGLENSFNRQGGRPEGPPTSVPTEDLETAALDLYREGHRSGFSEPFEGARRQELSNIVEELSERHARTPFDVARDLKAQAGSKDQPRPPLLLEGPPEEQPGTKPSKGRIMRGIGSLMRGRNVFSLIQALREGYELLPEEYQVLDEAFQYLKGTQFSIDKPGIESFKELLGISPEDLGGGQATAGKDRHGRRRGGLRAWVLFGGSEGCCRRLPPKIGAPKVQRVVRCRAGVNSRLGHPEN